eukprot:355767-Chlamydomonas_euryale.AAC.5
MTQSRPACCNLSDAQTLPRRPAGFSLQKSMCRYPITPPPTPPVRACAHAVVHGRLGPPDIQNGSGGGGSACGMCRAAAWPATAAAADGAAAAADDGDDDEDGAETDAPFATAAVAATAPAATAAVVAGPRLAWCGILSWRNSGSSCSVVAAITATVAVAVTAAITATVAVAVIAAALLPSVQACAPKRLCQSSGIRVPSTLLLVGLHSFA